MDALERDFIDAFLAFLNDPNAKAEATQARFMSHPYVKDRLRIFKVTDQPDFKPLQKNMREKLSALIRPLSRSERWNYLNEIIDALRRLQFDAVLPIQDPRTREIVGMPIKIGSLIDYSLKRTSIVIKNYPTISGVENACWYALALIAKDDWRERIRACPVKKGDKVCGKFYNTMSGQKNYCSSKCARIAEEENAKVRVWNLRHPDHRKPLPYPRRKFS
ncbi:MAG: hypothetical protein HY695_13460 [Deltaproteobacteria bacterium]|nr:hypothetical protein [Deltaproteobacteria bacterium]